PTGIITGPESILPSQPWTLRAGTQPGPRLPFAERLSSAAEQPLPETPTPPAPAAPDHQPSNGETPLQQDASPSAEVSFKAIQLYDAYVVVETPEGMLVIDQHALHERILFEQLKRRISAGPLETQRLLIPEPVELPSEQAAIVLEHRDALAELGLNVEEFGGGTLLLT